MTPSHLSGTAKQAPVVVAAADPSNILYLDLRVTPRCFLASAAVLILLSTLHELYSDGRLAVNVSTLRGLKNATTTPSNTSNTLSTITTTEVNTRTPDDINFGILESVDKATTIDLSDPTTYLPDYLRNQQKNKTSYSWLDLEPTQQLGFLHIPKTGGSSIELTAARASMVWGICVFWFVGECPNVGQPSKVEKGRAGINPWHTPLQHLDVNYTGSVNFNPNITNPYENHDLFAVIRNPYTRAVSEYYFHCTYEHCFWHEEDTPARLNSEIQKALETVKKAGKPSPGKMPSSEYFFHDGHWIPQSDYIFASRNGERHQLVQHILHFENLNAEFESLMETYHLPVNLSAVEHVTYREDGLPKPNCTVADLTPKTRRKIEKWYARDFELGGYTRIEKQSKGKL